MAKIPSSVSIGNTTFRRPWRIPEGLKVLETFVKDYPFEENTSSKFEKDLHQKLIDEGVVDSDKKGSDWVGRKFLANCTQYGFIATRPQVVKGKYKLNNKNEDENLIEILKNIPNLNMGKRPFSLTPLGIAFKNTTSDGKELTAEQKDIFLKSLFNHKQPSPAQEFPSTYKGETFYPIKLYIDIILELKNNHMEAHITPIEMAAIINDYKTNNIKNIIKEIKEFRLAFKKLKGHERDLGKQWYKKKERDIQWATARDYYDINFEAAINTGLFAKKGKKLIFKNEEIHIAKIISNFKYKYSDEKDFEYLENLWSGGLLPFENKELLTNEALNIIDKLEKEHQLKSDLLVDKDTSADVLKKTYYLNKDKYSNLQEIKYYKDQKNKGLEIIKILADIQKKNKEIYVDNEVIEVKPQHLEWIIWRVFLAINGFVNDIKKTRNFPIDDNFIASHYAGPGKEDMFFEFEDYALLIEPSFKEKRAQAKDEGEPVMFHCAKKINEFPGKPVYTLFVGPTIAPQLLNAYLQDFHDGNELIDKNKFNIVPLTINQISDIFEKLFLEKKILTSQYFKNILDTCLKDKNNMTAMPWGEHINKTVSNFLN